jgi:excisionase family DNA binding protein
MDASRLTQHDPWTPEEVAAAAKLTVRTVYRHIREGLLPAQRVGRQQYRIADADARRYAALEADAS